MGRIVVFRSQTTIAMSSDRTSHFRAESDSALRRAPLVAHHLDSIDKAVSGFQGPHTDLARILARMAYINSTEAVGGASASICKAALIAELQDLLNLVFCTCGFGAMVLPKEVQDYLRTAIHPNNHCAYTMAIFAN